MGRATGRAQPDGRPELRLRDGRGAIPAGIPYVLYICIVYIVRAARWPRDPSHRHSPCTIYSTCACTLPHVHAHMWQPPLQTVAASATYGCSLCYPRLQGTGTLTCISRDLSTYVYDMHACIYAGDGHAHVHLARSRCEDGAERGVQGIPAGARLYILTVLQASIYSYICIHRSRHACARLYIYMNSSCTTWGVCT